MNSKTKQIYDSLTPKQKKLVQKKLDERLKSHGKVGSGFFSNLVSGVKKVAAQASAALPVVKDIAVKAANAVVTKTEPFNPKWDYKAPANEKLHQVFKEPSGVYVAQWSGPGDIVIPKINALWDKYKGNVSQIVDPDNFADPIDLSAFLHDVLYTLAGDEPDKESVNKAIRAADEHLVAKLQKQQDAGNINAAVPLKLIKAKMFAEDKGAPVYGANEKIPDDQTRDRLNKIAEHLKMVGAGRPLRGSGQGLSKQLAEDNELHNLMKDLKQMEEVTGQTGKFSTQVSNFLQDDVDNLQPINRDIYKTMIIRAIAFLKSLSEQKKLKDESKQGDGKKESTRQPSNWIKHVKAVAKEKGISYTEALSVAGATYKK